VVTAWASGASWNDVLEMSGAAPGDLVRTLSRALDALKQIANLPYIPARGLDGAVQFEACGVHPRIRSLCKEAANEMDRYPVKDDLPFQEENEEQDDASEEESEMDEEIEVGA
jgi:superfamily II RNA helicase